MPVVVQNTLTFTPNAAFERPGVEVGERGLRDGEPAGGDMRGVAIGRTRDRGGTAVDRVQRARAQHGTYQFCGGTWAATEFEDTLGGLRCQGLHRPAAAVGDHGHRDTEQRAADTPRSAATTP